MAFDLASILEAFATLLRGGSADAGVPRALYLLAAPEGIVDATGNAADAYTVLAPYPGASLDYNVPAPELSLQLMTTGPAGDARAAVDAAMTFFNRLLDASGRPLRGVTLDGDAWRLVAVRNLRGPGVVGRDERKRSLIATNFDAKFVPLT